MKLKKLILMIMVLSLNISNNVQAQVPNKMFSFADLAEELLPSVVNISTTHDKDEPGEEGNDISNNIETNVNSVFNAPKTNKISLGSGFIIDENGYIITNNHVIDKAKSISVVTADNVTIEAKLIGKDSKTDLALIKIDTKHKLKPVKFGDSDKIRIGDWILAIGNPFGLGGSVTAGIISAKSRDIESGPYDSFIQTDASINQGSSGGPMFNMNGEVIGINTAIFSTNGGSMGIGFAIPVNLVDFVIKQLKANGNVKRGWIGIKMQPNSIEMAKSLGLQQKDGVIISSVSENSSAAKGGIQAGDIILSFDGHTIDNTKNLSRMVAETEIGKISEFELWRNNQRIIIKITIEEMPAELPTIKNVMPIDNESIDNFQDNKQENEAWMDDFGLQVENINAENRNRYSLSSDTQGVIVGNVILGSDAANKGIRIGDLITQIDKKTVLDQDDVKAYVKEAIKENRRPVLLQIKDGEQVHFVAVKLKSAPVQEKE